MLFLLCLPTPALDAGEALAIKVTPAQSFAPATLRVLVRVEPSADNRALEIVADSPDFYRSSLVPLDGDHAPRVMMLSFRSVPSGEYEIRGTLVGAEGRVRARDHRNAMVLASGDR